MAEIVQCARDTMPTLYCGRTEEGGFAYERRKNTGTGWYSHRNSEISFRVYAKLVIQHIQRIFNSSRFFLPWNVAIIMLISKGKSHLEARMFDTADNVHEKLIKPR